MLGLLARSARDTIVPIIRALLDRDDVTPGLVVSIRTFGSYAANFHPHVHALVPDGAFHQEGEFLPLPYFDARLVEEGFRHHLHQRPHRTERLSEEFQRSLLCWVRSGFSVHGEQTVPADDLKGAESLVQERLDHAGVKVIEARIPHLAYAPEIAQAMRQRQQAGAIIAARQRIVDGAVGMVEIALERLSKNNVVVLDEERKAAMVSNLLVVLGIERATQPVVNTGSIYH